MHVNVQTHAHNLHACTHLDLYTSTDIHIPPPPPSQIAQQESDDEVLDACGVPHEEDSRLLALVDPRLPAKMPCRRPKWALAEIWPI